MSMMAGEHSSFDGNFSSEYLLQYRERRIKFKLHQLTVKLIGKLFGLYPESIILYTDGNDGEQKVPDDDGRFHLLIMLSILLKVTQSLSLLLDNPSSSVEQLLASTASSAATFPVNALPYQKLLSPCPNSSKKPKRFNLKTKSPIGAEAPKSEEANAAWRKNI